MFWTYAGWGLALLFLALYAWGILDWYSVKRHAEECHKANRQLVHSLKAATSEDFLGLLRRANMERQKEWDTTTGGVSLSYRGNELAGEVGELCNILKKLEREALGIKGSRDTVEHAGEEGGDVLICLDLIFGKLGLDLTTCTRNKFNATSEKVGLLTRI